MKYYKVISNGAVIDANHIWLKWQTKHRILLGCEAHEANYIQSTDQAHVWRVQWLNPVPKGAPTFETVEAVEISEEEYLEIRKQLDDGFEVVVPEEIPEPEIPEDTPIEVPSIEVMTPEAMRRKIINLEAALAEQAKTNDVLTECLLEMSAIIYD
jgi:hypothetical protein